MKSKAQKLRLNSTLLGAVWNILKDAVIAGPSESRIQKLGQLIRKAPSADSFSQDEAAQLAGKLNIVCSWVFGGVGKALLKAVYRQHSSCATLESAPLLPFEKVLQPQRPQLYADAFVTLAGTRQAASRWPQHTTPLEVLKGSSNALGAVFFSNSGIKWAYRSSMPYELLAGAATAKGVHFLVGSSGFRGPVRRRCLLRRQQCQ